MKTKTIIISLAITLILIAGFITADVLLGNTSTTISARDLTTLKNYMVEKGLATTTKDAVVKPMVSNADCITFNETTNCKVAVYQAGIIDDFVIVNYPTANPLTAEQIRKTVDIAVAKRLTEFAKAVEKRNAKTTINTGGELVINGN